MNAFSPSSCMFWTLINMWSSQSAPTWELLTFCHQLLTHLYLLFSLTALALIWISLTHFISCSSAVLGWSWRLDLHNPAAQQLKVMSRDSQMMAVLLCNTTYCKITRKETVCTKLLCLTFQNQTFFILKGKDKNNHKISGKSLWTSKSLWIVVGCGQSKCSPPVRVEGKALLF